MQFLPGSIELSKNPFEKEFWKLLRRKFSDFDGIIAYKIPSLGNKNYEDTPSFILRSISFGVIIIDVIGDDIKEIVEDGRFWVKSDGEDLPSRDYILSSYHRDLENKLSKSLKLYDHKQGKFKFPSLVNRLLIFANNSEDEVKELDSGDEFSSSYICERNIEEELDKFLKPLLRKDLNNEIIDEVDSILEGTSIFNRRTKRIVDNPATRNDFIKKSLIETFKLDSIQRSVALQIPNGPQRIRGLAGTGKTIILSMKAALTHMAKREEDFKILFVFNTQSMYKQIIENIEKYTIEESSSSPNWDNLKVLHAWGGSRREGLYSMLCDMYSITPKTYFDAKGHDDPFQYIYEDLLASTKGRLTPIFDMVLIDEAQDFPPAFFETIFHITKEPKRIIWAYDEFQSLNELKIVEPSSVFGLNKEGEPNIPDNMLEGEYEGGIKKDFMLPNSYRNPRKVLMYAHGLGLGLYTKDAKVPMEDKISWEARGYKIEHPLGKDKFEQDDHIIVERPREFSKNILESLIETHGADKINDLILYKHNENIKAELDYVIEGIRNLIKVDKIEPEEIIVISLDKRSAKSHFNYIRSQLLGESEEMIHCITPGFVEPTDRFKEKGRVTLTTPFRAKGNEANIVFVINAHGAIGDRTLRERNALFVAITRSRGWCFVSGSGLSSLALQKEIERLEEFYPKFNFTFPKKSDYQRRLKIISLNDKNLSKTEDSINEILKDDSNIALLLDKAKDNPDLIKKIREMLGDD